jgi:hypothetical protein
MLSVFVFASPMIVLSGYAAHAHAVGVLRRSDPEPTC